MAQLIGQGGLGLKLQQLRVAHGERQIVVQQMGHLARGARQALELVREPRPFNVAERLQAW